jgi:Fe-S oxidoreductase
MMTEQSLKPPIMKDLWDRGEVPEILFWVGCAGAFDTRYQKVTRSLFNILTSAGVKFAILGKEESCTGDPAKRAGNEFLFQAQALKNIQILNGYQIKKIVTACPHCYNTLKNEYPSLGGQYELFHHTEFLIRLIREGRITTGKNLEGDVRIVYHDSCYLGRGNNIYDSPRFILRQLKNSLLEMKRSHKNSFCCGAGGAQMFKESEKGRSEINVERTKEAINTGANIIATACPFCLTMLEDGVKNENREEDIKVLDIIELFEKSLIKNQALKTDST